MKQYLGTCRAAQEARMLRQLEERQHFVDNAHMFSLQDLIDVNSGVLVEYLTKVHASFASHIKNECLVSCCTVLCVVVYVLGDRNKSIC